MLRDLLADSATRGGDRTFFRHGGRTCSYAEVQDRALDLAERLHGQGVEPGERLAIDLTNGPDLVFTLLAGPMLGISFFLLNTRLTAPKKAELLGGFEVTATVDEEFLAALRSEPPTGFEPPGLTCDDVFVRMFTSGTTGLPKAARLTYGALEAAARASAEVLMTPGAGCWQLTLPMYHVGGLQVMFRSLVNGSPFILYDRFDAAAVLADVASGEATHVSVVDRTLRELIATDPDLLRRYEAVLLGGGPVNERTLGDAAGANVWASYGMTETCGAVAASAPGRYAEGLRPLPGCDVRIVGADTDGCGEIAVSGPSVFSGYEPRRGEPASPARFDGAYFLTGDEGRLADGGLFVSERTADVFISGGENVYPAEIEREILAVDGVESAAVIGVEDPDWGRRPVAFAAGAGADQAAIVEHLERRLTRFQRPDAVFVLDRIPHGGVGKTDRAQLARRWADRIEVDAVRIYRIVQPLTTPFRTSRGEITERESVIVEVIDREGRAGYGEGVAFSTPWYSAETVASTIAALTERLAPVVLASAYLHPAEVSASLGAPAGDLMAAGAIEPACWDLYGRIVGRPLPEILAEWAGVEPGDRAPAGVSLGVMPIERTLAEVARFVEKGYRRVKLKIRPGDDIERVRAVREAHPDLMLMADANRGYGAADVEVFRALDEFGLVCVEEPIAADGIEELAAFQGLIATPVCVDESIRDARDLDAVLASPNLRNVNLKIGKYGGVLPSLLAYRRCLEAEAQVWLGGMYETGVSKYLHAQFETLPGFTIPGDISETQRYFERDIVIPPVTVRDGDVVLPEGPGLGFEPDFERIGELLIDTIEMRRHAD